MNNAITVSTTVKAPVEKVWKLWTTPEDICQWNAASPDWHTPSAVNDLRTGGLFSFRMEAKDKSFGFDMGGEYTRVVPHQFIDYTMGDGRMVSIEFIPEGANTKIVEAFEAESQNPVEMQKGGWQAIMDSFKAYAEAQ